MAKVLSKPIVERPSRCNDADRVTGWGFTLGGVTSYLRRIGLAAYLGGEEFETGLSNTYVGGLAGVVFPVLGIAVFRDFAKLIQS